jgi:CTP-dependent riboflavin kinase
MTILEELQSRYNKATINKRELSKEIGCSIKTIERKIKEGMDIPRYIRSTDSRNGTYLFPIVEVAKFLESKLVQVA